eukprot:TRINITY_DN67848_c7_g1_i1.p1 TRINITY_DN67848_c7_g1~~TRINITY_DN67848_c7_g1_i1.p1  ORF type:complete len:363 (+),score=44.12 TRINITY_DN67848_c7_g1_i1:68-1156(+)
MDEITDLQTLLVHGDDDVPNTLQHLTPPLSLTTCWRHEGRKDGFSYARHNQPNRLQCEELLGAMEGGHAVVYPAGMGAMFATLFHTAAKRIVLRPAGGYYETRVMCNMFKDKFGCTIVDMADDVQLQKGDLVMLETPINPTCDVLDIQAWAEKAHEVGAELFVDGSFCPPPMQYALKLGADYVMYSACKHLSGTHDCQLGVLVVATEEKKKTLLYERTITGSIPGAMQLWLLQRSLRTLELRVKQQCQTTDQLVPWLVTLPQLEKVHHPSLETCTGHEVAKRQMKMFGSVVSIEFREGKDAALSFLAKVKVIIPSTSFGGVASQADYRHSIDPTQPPGLVRLSVGLESLEVLKGDIEQAVSS